MDIKDLKLNDGKFLVKLARESVRTFFENSEPKIENVPNILNEKFGAFVTIKKNNELRGCIGYPFPIKPLYVAIIELAREAAFNDPRFLPLRKNELNEVIFEVSVLSKFELIKVKNVEEYIEKFNIGEGLYLETTFASALLLPQVAIEYNLNKKEFLEALCLKAGLEKNAWKNREIKIYKFRARIFAEKEPNGEIIEITF